MNRKPRRDWAEAQVHDAKGKQPIERRHFVCFQLYDILEQCKPGSAGEEWINGSTNIFRAVETVSCDTTAGVHFTKHIVKTHSSHTTRRGRCHPLRTWGDGTVLTYFMDCGDCAIRLRAASGGGGRGTPLQLLTRSQSTPALRLARVNQRCGPATTGCRVPSPGDPEAQV